MYVPFNPRLSKLQKFFESVGVNLPVNIAFRMVNRLVREVLIVKSLIGHEGVGIDRALSCDMSANLRLQVIFAASGNDIRVNLATPFQNADDRRFILYSTFCNYTLAPRRMHESSGTADESLVYFHFATGTAEFHKVLVVHCKPNAVHHEPSRFLSDSKSAGHFIGANSVLGVHDEPNGNHPLVHAERGVFKDSSNLDRKLFFAALAEPMAARRDKRVFRSLAAWARYLAVRPAQLYRIFERVLRVREESDCFLQRPWKRECLAHGQRIA